MPINISTQLILDEAERRGITLEWLTEPSCYSLTFANRTELFDYRYWSKQGLVPFELCRNKNRFKKMMQKNGLPSAQGESFKPDDLNSAIEFATKVGWPVVLKPCSESHGRGVCLSIADKSAFSENWANLSKKKEIIVVEKMYFGEEYRIFVTDEKVISVLNRVPANVTGDGKHTISELIDIKNNDPVRNACKSMKKLIVDDEVKNKLQADGLTLDSVLPDGRYLQIRYASNVALGGDSVDVTAEIHPSVGEIAVAAVKAIPGLKYGGMDFMTEDIKADQSTVSHAIIELNKSPEIEINHYPLHGKPRDCAGAILDLAFPETAKEGI